MADVIEDAERLARDISQSPQPMTIWQQLARDISQSPQPMTIWQQLDAGLRLADLITSGAYAREIERRALERVAEVIWDRVARHGNASTVQKCCNAIRPLIPAPEPDKEAKS